MCTREWGKDLEHFEKQVQLSKGHWGPDRWPYDKSD